MRRAIALISLSACLLVAGCSSSGGDSSSGSGDSVSTPSVPGLKGTVNTHGTLVAKDGKVEVELDDKYFEPTFIKAKAGEKLTLELKNEGSLEHNFSLTGTKVNEDIEAGDTKTVTVTVPDTPTVYFCEYHQSAGMQGAFLVT
jgi:plastocyanin